MVHQWRPEVPDITGFHHRSDEGRREAFRQAYKLLLAEGVCPERRHERLRLLAQYALVAGWQMSHLENLKAQVKREVRLGGW